MQEAAMLMLTPVLMLCWGNKKRENKPRKMSGYLFSQSACFIVRASLRNDEHLFVS